MSDTAARSDANWAAARRRGDAWNNAFNLSNNNNESDDR